MIEITKSLNFNGTTQSIDSLSASGTKYSFDIANTWSVMVTVKPTSVAGTRTYFHLSDVCGDTSDTDNMIEIKAIGSDVRFTIVGSKGHGGSAKVYDFNATVTGSIWSQLLATWDGADLSLYHQGVIRAPSTKIVDNTLTQTSSVDKGLMLADSFITQNDEFEGNLYSGAIWDVELSAAAVLSIWNCGVASGVDLGTNFDAYNSSSRLQHWYRLGFDQESIGKDYGASSTLADLSSLSTTSGNIVTDFPGI